MKGLNELKLIDSHCHINFSAYKDDAEQVIQRASDLGIGLFAVGSQSSTSARAIEYAEKYENVWAVIGLHPIHLFSQEVDESETGEDLVKFKSRSETPEVDFYRDLANSSKKVIGIGECGLDYYHVPDEVDFVEFKYRQELAFRNQIQLALDLGVPLMIHSRDAIDGSTDIHSDIRNILKDFINQGKKVRGNIHCFSGTVKDAELYVEMGMYISFTGNITYKPRPVNQHTSETLLDVARAVPMERILVETDAPYLTPVPHRGKRNEPAYVRFVADKIAELKNISSAEVNRITLSNTVDLFNL